MFAYCLLVHGVRTTMGSGTDKLKFRELTPISHFRFRTDPSFALIISEENVVFYRNFFQIGVFLNAHSALVAFEILPGTTLIQNLAYFCEAYFAKKFPLQPTVLPQPSKSQIQSMLEISALIQSECM